MHGYLKKEMLDIIHEWMISSLGTTPDIITVEPSLSMMLRVIVSTHSSDELW